MIQVWVSKYTPGAKGSQMKWDIGDKAIYTLGSTGNQIEVTIDSELMTHSDAPGNHLVYECIFSDDGKRYAAYANNLKPIFTEQEISQMKEMGLV